VRGALLVSFLSLAGCGSYWDIRKGEELSIGCAGLLNWYPDADGDQWGDPGSAPTPRCGPDQEKQLTASNALDCDDADVGITGRVGALCPGEMFTGADPEGSRCVAGTRSGESEFVTTCEGSPLVGFTMARQDCEAWAGWITPEAAEQGAVGQHGLASLQTEFEFAAVTEWLETVANGEPIAVWVDLQWTGTIDSSSGAWQWPDNGGTLPNWVPPCGDTDVGPVDFWPDLVVGLPESDTTLEESLDEVRQALIYDGTEWCRGVPDALGTPFGPREAFALCERPAPILTNFEDVPDEEGNEPPEG
jgi:hypothetical protein